MTGTIRPSCSDEAAAAIQGAAAASGADAGARTLTVPLNTRAVVAIAPERVRRLREHLVRTLRALGATHAPHAAASPLRAEPPGFAGTVAHAACTLCAGFCCREGGDHAYIDGRDLARVRQARPDLTARDLVRVFVERVPAEGYAGSCIYHGRLGCTLDRSLRSDVCNSYFCHELREFIGTTGASLVRVVGVAEDGTTRRLPSLRPLRVVGRRASRPAADESVRDEHDPDEQAFAACAPAPFGRCNAG